MFGSDLYIALVLGVTLSLIFTERTGILPAGLVVPGYLALVFNQPVFMLVVLFISILTYVIVTYGVSRFMILYGRRKFAATLITGICLKLLFDYCYPVMP
ncbi:TPA: capsular polyglutamate amide ligase/translocase PgsC, partial [Bacillus anthracis]|nr:capsular polyglutamate amide ligase/translocase PgsC [Bacillus anthracis]